MSYAPQPLLDLQEYLHNQTGIPYVGLGIVGDANHTTGYHLGADRIGPGDYSAQTSRDRDGLSNAASAIDIGWFSSLVALTKWMVSEARAGHRKDTREIIGPGGDGRAYRWAKENNWVAQIRASGDSHETHTHESFYRDSEYDNKITFFRTFFEGEGMDYSEFKAHMDKWWDERAGGSGGTNAEQRRIRSRVRLAVNGTPEDDPATPEDEHITVDKRLTDQDAVLAQILATVQAGGGNGNGGGLVAHTHDVTGTGTVSGLTGPAVPEDVTP